MKLVLKSLAAFALAISVSNCGDKKETDAMGNTVDETTETTAAQPETASDPLLAKGQKKNQVQPKSSENRLQKWLRVRVLFAALLGY